MNNEQPHPVLKVPGHGKNLRWDREIGRWIVDRKPVTRER